MKPRSRPHKRERNRGSPARKVTRPLPRTPLCPVVATCCLSKVPSSGAEQKQFSRVGRFAQELAVRHGLELEVRFSLSSWRIEIIGRPPSRRPRRCDGRDSVLPVLHPEILAIGAHDGSPDHDEPAARKRMNGNGRSRCLVQQWSGPALQLDVMVLQWAYEVFT